MTVIEVKENGAIRTKMLSCDSPIDISFSRTSCGSKSRVGFYFYVFLPIPALF